MKLLIPFEPLMIVFYLQQNNQSGYIVGGAVRDLILQTKDADNYVIKDWDFTTNAQPKTIQQIFQQSYYENEFGTVCFTHENLLEQLKTTGFNLPNKTMNDNQTKIKSNLMFDITKAKKIHHSLKQSIDEIQKHQHKTEKKLPPFEITTFRSDGIYRNHRKPDTVNWGESIAEDLQRRDFTINSLALKINKKWLNDNLINKNINTSYVIDNNNFSIIDNHHGLQDLDNKIIKTVGNPNARFQEDALRMLRAIRLAVQLNFSIEKQTFLAIQKHRNLINRISAERVREELFKILLSKKSKTGIHLLQKSHLLSLILPELEKTQGLEQSGHHTTDVYTHSLNSLQYCPSNNPIVKLAALIHDIGKAETHKIINKTHTFYNHEVVGSRMANTIAKRLKLSNKQKQKIFTLVRHHMFYYQSYQSDNAIRRMMKRIGLKNLNDIFCIREGDRLGSGSKKSSWRLEELKQRMYEQLNQPMDIKDLEIDGNDLIKKFNLKPSPLIGEILESLFSQVSKNPQLNSKSKLLKLAENYLN